MLEPQHAETTYLYDFTLPESRDEGGMWLHWLTRLRWAAIAGVLITTSLTYQVLTTKAIALPVIALSVVALVAANGSAAGRLGEGQRISTASLLNHLSIDVIALTAMFAVSGGSDNPFVILYLVHVVMAAVMLPAGVMVGFTAMVLVMYFGLHIVHLPLGMSDHFVDPDMLMQAGQAVAMFVTVGGVATFTLGMSNSLRRHQRRLFQAGLPRTATEEVEGASHGAHAH